MSMDNEMNEIRVSGLTKRYDGHAMLECLDAVFPAGSRTALMGPSGCGKTTLLRLLMGLEKADEGRVSGIPEKMTAVFQEDRLCEGFSAVRNLQAVLPGRAVYEELAGALAAVGLTENLNKPVRTFSGGMKRRVAIVRACLGDGSVLFLDEPFKGLDETTREQTAVYIKENLRGRTLIMTTHDREEASLMDAQIMELGQQ